MLISYFCVTAAIGSTVFACQRCVGNAFRRWVLVCFPFIVLLLFLVLLYVFSFSQGPCFQTSSHMLSPCVISGDALLSIWIASRHCATTLNLSLWCMRNMGGRKVVSCTAARGSAVRSRLHYGGDGNNRGEMFTCVFWDAEAAWMSLTSSA